LVDAANVLVLDARLGPGLAHESLGTCTAAEKLQGHGSPEDRVLGTEDHADRALADERAELVAEARANKRRDGGRRGLERRRLDLVDEGLEQRVDGLAGFHG